MAESDDSPLEKLRALQRIGDRNEILLSELASRSDAMPLSVAVFADDLAMQCLEQRKLKLEDVLAGCENIYRMNGLDFSYDRTNLPELPAAWTHSPNFPLYLGLGRSIISGACIFEGQDIFLQSKVSTAIFLTGHIRVGNGRANDVLPEFRGRGVMVVGAGDYDFVQDVKYQWRAVVADALCVFMALLGLKFFFFNSFLFDNFFWSALVISCITVGGHFFLRWFEFRMTDYGYTHYLFSTMAHEQAHLFGIEHVDDEESLMFPYGSKTKRFDPVSKENLLKILKPLE